MHTRNCSFYHKKSHTRMYTVASSIPATTRQRTPCHTYYDRGRALGSGHAAGNRRQQPQPCSSAHHRTPDSDLTRWHLTRPGAALCWPVSATEVTFLDVRAAYWYAALPNDDSRIEERPDRRSVEAGARRRYANPSACTHPWVSKAPEQQF